MASAALLNSLKRVPVPLFGSATTAVAWTGRKLSLLPKLAPWALPLSMGGMWFVWPAVDEEWKQSIGLGSSPAAAAAPAPAEEEKKVELSQDAKEKIEKAYVVEESGEEKEELTDDEKAVMKAVAAGDYSVLEKDWDAFQQKAMVPGDGDDDDDDEEDDEDDEDEEEDEE